MAFLSSIRRTKQSTRWLTLRAIGAIWIFALAGVARADWKEDVGYNQLVTTLTNVGIAVPNGNNVPVVLVESLQIQPGVRNYKPDPAYVEFNADGDPLLQAVTFIDASNNNCGSSPCTPTAYSTHARGMAQTILGNTLGLAPATNSLTLYEANDYLSSVLRAPASGTPISQANFRVQNFSWVGAFQTTGEDVSTLRRFDFMIDRDNVTAVVGLNNNTAPLPSLLGQSYNSIGVGMTGGLHSSGLTNLVNYGPGRSKPDVVAPQGTASLATASVSSAATLLHGVVAGTDAAKSQVMKAMLMAGATKEEFPTWTRSASQPLDDTFGAGELNVFNSYLMTLGGRYAGSSLEPVTVGSHGWDFQSAVPGAGNELKYRFAVPAGSTAQDLSILLTWNVNVAGGFTGQTLANLNMTLSDSLGQTVDQSLSAVDNVEHIYLPTLAPGDYTLSISTDTSRDFGLAWRMSTLFDVPSADFDEDGDVDGRDFLTWQRGYGKLINALHAEGDANGDGAVNQQDLALLQAQYGPLIVDPPSLLASIPEPAGVVLLAGGALGFALKRRRP